MFKRIILTLGMGMLFLSTGMQQQVEAAPDAVSAASLVVTITKVTATEVYVDYLFDERSGTRNFCYAIAPATPANTCVTQTPRALTGSLVAKGLTSNSQYNYALSAVDPSGKHKTSTTRGTFTTIKQAPVAIPAKDGQKAPNTLAGRRSHLGTGFTQDLLGRDARFHRQTISP